MKFDPQIHQRRSIRLKGYDYSQEGAYFITICCQNKILRFGNIEACGVDDIDVQMILSDFGQAAYDEWLKLPQRFSNVELNVFQIMPNHMHGIIILKSNTYNPHANVGAGLAPALRNTDKPQSAQQDITTPNAPIGDIIGSYKSLVSLACLKLFKSSINLGITNENEMMGKLWQRNFFEVIIRNEEHYMHIADYIINNPLKWKEDKFYCQ